MMMAPPLAKSQPLSLAPTVGGLTKPIKYVPVRVGEIAAVHEVPLSKAAADSGDQLNDIVTTLCGIFC